MMAARNFLLEILVISTLCLIHVQSEDSTNFDWVNRKFRDLCRGISSIKDISKMQELIDMTRRVSESNSSDSKSSSAASTIHRPSASVFSKFNQPTCLINANAILDLEPIISEQTNVCSSAHAHKIQSYYGKYNLNSNRISRLLSPTRKFFSLYVRQVSFKCKQNLLHSLNLASNLLAEQISIYDQLLPLEKLNNVCQAQDLIDRSPSTRAQCEAFRTLASIDTLEVLAPSMDKNLFISKKILDSAEATSDQQSTDENKYLEIIKPEVRKNIKRIEEICRELKPVYENTISPLIRIIHLNLDSHYPEFEQRCHQEEMMKKWFRITLVCESVLTSKLAANLITGDSLLMDNNAQNNFAQVPEYINYQQSIEDNLWIDNYSPSLLAKLKDSLLTNLSKALKIDQLKEIVLINKGISTAKDIVFGLLVVSISLIGIATNVRLMNNYH